VASKKVFFPHYNFLCSTILKDSSWNGICSEHISYNDVLAGWKNICSTVLDREGRFGAHSGRKTGYLFGIWGGAQDSDLMLSARHKTLKNALAYKRDAAFLLALARENNSDLTLCTPKWRSLYCEHYQLAMELNRASRVNVKSNFELARIFVCCKLGVPIDNMVRHSRVVGDKLLCYSHEYGCLDETKQELQKILSTLDPKLGNKIASLHSRILEQLQPQQQQSQPLDETTILREEEEIQPYKKKRGGEWDHTSRSTLGKVKDNASKIKAIVEIQNKSGEEGIAAHMMTEVCRTFFKETAVPIVNCLNNHFQNNMEAFLARYTNNGKFTHSKFHKNALEKEMHAALCN